MNLFDLLAQTARRFPRASGVYLGKQPVATWSSLHERALRFAATLRARHPAGARVAVASENRPEILETMFGTWAAGQALVPINYKLHPREMADIIADAGASLVVASPDLAAGLQAALAAVPAGAGAAEARPVVVIGEASYAACFELPPDPERDA